jgi:lysyl-tRNA synthetase class II
LKTRKGRIFKTCSKCREKGRKNDNKQERREKRDELQKEKGAEYSEKFREKKKSGTVDEHKLEQTCQWSQSEKTKERVSQWKRLNINDRIGNYRRSAISKGRQWKLTDDEAKSMLTSPCTYCTHLDLENKLNGIDRLDQKGDYTPQNTVPCCWTCNYMKGVMDPSTFIEKCKKISECIYIFPEVARQEIDISSRHRPVKSL